MSRILRTVLGALVVFALFAATAPGALAVPPPADEGESTPVMVVLDASGSMKQTDAPGPRIDAAKRAVTGLVAALPADARVGLTVYGTSTGSGAGEKAAGCKDIKQLIPVQPVDRAAFGTAVAGIKASGYTPIGRSLQEAAKALPTEGPRSVVLVSDGEDTCAPPAPCDVAKQLKAAGTDLVVHTIGFKVGAAARAQLSCIAAATGGTFREASSGAALGAVLETQVQRAIKPYTAVGTPIRGGADPASAPTIRPGQYLDTYEKGSRTVAGRGTVKYYAIDLQPGDTPYVSATLIPPAVRAENITALVVRVTLVDASDDDCTSGNAFASAVAVFGKVVPQSAVIAPGPVGDKGWDEECSDGRPVYVRVERSGNTYNTAQLPMEIAFRIEPAITSAGPAAVPAPLAALPAPAESATRPVEAGFSFNDAPLLQPGSYAGSIGSGETRFYRVRLGWGQRLAYQLVVPAQAGVGIQSAALYVTLSSPLRAKVEQSSGTPTYQLIGGKEDQSMHGSTAAPVRWSNRESSSSAIRLYSVDGDYFIVLDASYPLARPMFTMPFRLTVATDGAVEPGPSYVTDPAGSASPAPSASPTAVASGGADGSGSQSGTSPVLWGGAAVGILAVAAAVAGLAVRRRRRFS
ncbi:MAG TPA: VWA domain-containing protein [Mycobacteriales bacterium]|nr:VWA domain-containing protein [Mycobacteriales bacterium]